MPTLSLGPNPTQITHFDSDSEIFVRVKGSGTLLLSENFGDSSNSVGMEYVASDGPQRIVWKGELWAKATVVDNAGEYQFIFSGQDLLLKAPQVSNPGSTPSSWVLGLLRGIFPRKQANAPTDEQISKMLSTLK